MAIQIICDICGRVIPELERNDHNTNYIILSSVSGVPKEYKNVCETCMVTVLKTIENLKNTSVINNAALRELAFKAYQEAYQGGRNGILPAIKYIRSITKLGLKESKDIIEEWRDKYNWPR